MEFSGRGRISSWVNRWDIEQRRAIVDAGEESLNLEIKDRSVT